MIKYLFEQSILSELSTATFFLLSDDGKIIGIRFERGRDIFPSIIAIAESHQGKVIQEYAKNEKIPIIEDNLLTLSLYFYALTEDATEYVPNELFKPIVKVIYEIIEKRKEGLIPIDNTKRCKWCKGDALLTNYHDYLGGFAHHSDNSIFESLTIAYYSKWESLEYALYNKSSLRKQYNNYLLEPIAKFDKRKKRKIKNDVELNRHLIISENAKISLGIINEEGSLSSFLNQMDGSDKKKVNVVSQTFYEMDKRLAKNFLIATGYIELEHSSDCFLSRNQ